MYRHPEHSIRDATDNILFLVTKVTFLYSINFIRDSLLNIAGYCFYYESNVYFQSFAVISVLKIQKFM